MPLLHQDTSVADKVESWTRLFGVSAPPHIKSWPVSFNIPDTRCMKQPMSKSSTNICMWDILFPVTWQYFLDDKSQHHIAWDRVCIITPYRAMTAHIQDFLQEQGIEIDVDYDGNSALEHRGRARARFCGPDGPTTQPMAMDTATIDSYQGQEQDLVIVFTTVPASSGANLLPTAIGCASGLPG